MTSSTRLSYIPGLDGIRALAVLAVLCYHANSAWALGGFLGVETFFVLSGFLITLLLVSEWQASGRIDLRKFWLRRARRLLPAVWFLLFVLPLLALLFAREALSRLAEDIPAAFFYVTNWVYIFRQVPYFEVFGRPPLLQQLWSLAVEEQFYLLWPVILLFLLPRLKNNRLLWLAALSIMILISSSWMAILYSPSAQPLRVYYGTDTRAAGFLIGASLAVFWPSWGPTDTKKRREFEISGWVGLLVLLILFNVLNEFRPFLYRGGFLITALASALLIAGATNPVTSLSQLLENRSLRWVGTRSYSIYLWHWPVFVLSRPGFDIHLPELPVRLGQLALVFGLAELSYRWIESPIRHHGFRSSFRSWQAAFKRLAVPQRLALGAALILTGLLLAWQSTSALANRRPNGISVSQTISTPRESGSAMQPGPFTDVQAALHTPAPIPTAIAAQEDSNRLRSTSTVTPSSHLPRVTFIGDSIMQGASPMMEDRLGEDIYIDAARKRRMEDVPALIETLAQEDHLGSVVVIHLGSNRPFEASVFDQVMESLLTHQVKRIIFMNVHRPIGWEHYLNNQFKEDVARWPQTELIDWDVMAHSQQEWFIDDQTHLSYEGSEAYVTAIQEKLRDVR